MADPGNNEVRRVTMEAGEHGCRQRGGCYAHQEGEPRASITPRTWCWTDKEGTIVVADFRI